MKDSIRHESIWRQFMQLTRECVVDIDLSTRRVECSAPFLRALKLTPETVPHTLDQWFELYHPDDYSRSLDFNRYLKSGEETFSVERRLYCGDGEYRFFRLEAFGAHVGGIKNARLVGIETDISARRELRLEREDQANALRGLEERLALAEEWARNLQARLVESEAAREILSDQLFAAQSLLDVMDPPACLWGLNGRPFLQNSAFRRLAAESADFARLFLKEGENEATCRDSWGRERVFSVEVRPFKTRHAVLSGRLGIFREETERLETEKDLQRIKRLLGFSALRSSDGGAELPPPLFAPEETAWAETDFTSPQEERAAFDVGEVLELLNRFACSLAEAELLPTRLSQLRELVTDVERAELEVGVVGITSSGKSAFVNAMMGERLLPEETRATTNLLIRCRKGGERAVVAVGKDGSRSRISGQDLTSFWMESLASERDNPSNEKEIAYLEWTAPGAALPEGLVLIDTPGLDACGFPEHSELVLRRLLPRLDIVLYVTSIRNRFKNADLELLKAVLEQNQRVVFLLSQIDLERDDVEGGRVVFSRRQKLASYVKELREDIAAAYLSGSAVIPISSRLAMAHFYDRASSAWGASNFSSLMCQLEIFRDNLSRYRAESRGCRALALLERTAADLGLIVERVENDAILAETSQRAERIRGLKDAQRWAHAEISAVRNEWRRRIGPERRSEELERELGAISTLQALRNRYESLRGEWDEMLSGMTERMDRSRLLCGELLRKYALTPPDRGSPLFAVNIDRELREDREILNLDRDKMLKTAKALLGERLRFMDEHLAWWENWMREEYCSPLYEELAREEGALAEVRRISADTSVPRAVLQSVVEKLRETERGIKEAMRGLELPEPESFAEERFFEDLEAAGDIASSGAEERGFFAPLLAIFNERSIQTRFVELESVRRSRRILLLGLRRHDGIRLLSRLAHDVFWGESLSGAAGEFRELDWVFCGSTPPALPYVAVPSPDTLLRDLEILVAPSDALCEDSSFRFDWNDLFAEWLPVVHLDISRVDSGLSDLARAPYFSALRWAECWVAASGQGALFDGRLADLLTDVPRRVDDFTAFNGYKSQPEWFVYENYDARYTDFLLWGRQLLEEQGDDARRSDSGEALLEKWTARGYEFSSPFSEHRMRLTIEAARRKSRIFPTGRDSRSRSISN